MSGGELVGACAQCSSGCWKSALELPGGQTLDTCAQKTVPREKGLAKLPLPHSTWNVVFKLCCFYPCGTELFSECLLGIVCVGVAYHCVAHHVCSETKISKNRNLFFQFSFGIFPRFLPNIPEFYCSLHISLVLPSDVHEG